MRNMTVALAWGRPLGTWLLFWGLFLVVWRVDNLFLTLPHYGDALEITWGIEWYAQHFPRAALLTNPDIFYPAGWPVATLAQGPALFLPLLPLNALGGLPFAYNALVILLSLLAFAGLFRLARSLTLAHWTAVLAAALFTFWPYRWLRAEGHLNLFMGTALLPWLLWSFRRALHAPARWPRRALLTGLIWGAAINASLYFLWLGGLALALWGLGAYWTRRVPLHRAGLALGLSALVAAVLAAPYLFFFWVAHRADPALFSINEGAALGASLNSIFIPHWWHPLLAPVAHSLYRGPVHAGSLANLGLAAALMALLGLGRIYRRPAWRPALLVLASGWLLGLGYALKWNDMPLQAPFLEPLNATLWRLGYRLKPFLFGQSEISPFWRHIWPLPGYFLAILVPFWEGARATARFLFVAAPIYFILAALGVERLRPRAGQLLLGLLLLIEVAVPMSFGQADIWSGHPAYIWLAQPETPPGGIIDLHSLTPGALQLRLGGETLWAARFHGRPNASGAGGIWPAPARALIAWFAAHDGAGRWPEMDPEFQPLLRRYGVRYLVLHMNNSLALPTQARLAAAGDLDFIGCFDPPPRPSPWAYDICIYALRG